MRTRTTKVYTDPDSDEEMVRKEESSSDSEESEEPVLKVIRGKITKGMHVYVQDDKGKWIGGVAVRNSVSEPTKWHLKFDNGSRDVREFVKGEWKRAR
jgi:hypothetical protein